MAVKNRLQAEGRLVCHQGYIKGYEPMGEQVEVTYRPRGTTQETKLRVRHVLTESLSFGWSRFHVRCRRKI
jgi:uncharacterized NAD(P)/FAD-binding protein YdhS